MKDGTGKPLDTDVLPRGLPAIGKPEDRSEAAPTARAAQADPSASEEIISRTANPAASTIKDEDYYYDGPYLVFTAAYHLRRGVCCGSGCRHCPYR